MQNFAEPLTSVAATTTFRVGGASPAPGQMAKEEATEESFLDWNDCQPDGSEKSLRGVLARLAQIFRGQVHLGLTVRHGNLEIYAEAAEPATSDPLLRSAVSEALQSRQACLFATAGGQSSLVLQRYREVSQDALVLGFGAAGPNTQTPPAARELDVGLVIGIRRSSDLQTKETYSALIARTQQELRVWLRVWDNCRLAAQTSPWQKHRNFYRTRKGKIGLAIGLLLVFSLAIPLPYWPQRACTVEPASKSFVASPVDGRIGDVTVRPGDVVAQGALLARLDDEQIRWDLSAAEADYAAAGKRRDAALASRAGGELRLAQLEQERIALQLESLTRQLENLELRSPADGIVVRGDWFQSNGAPVSRGDTLFEIAPLHTMQIEVQLTTEDLAHIQVGEQATVRVDAAPGSSWQAQLSRIDPRATVIDSEVYFIADMEVANEANQLRPGMKGRVRIEAGSQSLGWLLFHRPYLWALKKLAW